jgi:hypothetical protein
MRRRRRLAIIPAVVGLIAAACGLNDSTVLLRSDMPTQGMNASVRYVIEATPDGTSEINQATLQGLNDLSPLPLLTTTFGKSTAGRNQLVQATAPDGTAMNVLGMNTQERSFGLTDFLKVYTTTYETRDADGQRSCGAKVRLNFQPNAIQFFNGDRRSWDALWYYAVPCGNDADDALDLERAEFVSLVINQQVQFRITGKPLLFNRGHSVTVVGGAPAAFPGGWWLRNAGQGSNHHILGAAELIRDMVKDLDTGPDSEKWLSFDPAGPFASSQLVYSAGDADAFLTLNKQILRRENNYVVHFRSDPGRPWRRIVVRPVYNYEWNDFAQNWEALKGHNPLKVDDRVDEYGFPEDPNDPVIKEIETAGCQNCPNATLEQIQFIDYDTESVLYAMTVRGYIGANDSLVMFGAVPEQGRLTRELTAADRRRQEEGTTTCPVRYDDEGERLGNDEQYSSADCARLLREGAMWSYITENPDEFGFDLVSQYRVRDNSTWGESCSGSGDSISCFTYAIERKLDANYLFNTTDVVKPWTIMQLLGEVGVRTLGVSYASGQYSGNGMLFAMAQPLMRQQYFDGLTSPEMVFAFDARALQLPQTLGAAEEYLFGLG